MADVRMPLSGDVNQVINPWTFAPSWTIGSITVNVGESSDPEVERQVLKKVGSYGRQLGRIEDALVVLLRHLPKETKLDDEETKAIDALKKMLDGIADVKKEHSRPSALTLK